MTLWRKGTGSKRKPRKFNTQLQHPESTDRRYLTMARQLHPNNVEAFRDAHQEAQGCVELKEQAGKVESHQTSHTSSYLFSQFFRRVSSLALQLMRPSTMAPTYRSRCMFQNFNDVQCLKNFCNATLLMDAGYFRMPVNDWVILQNGLSEDRCEQKGQSGGQGETGKSPVEKAAAVCWSDNICNTRSCW